MKLIVPTLLLAGPGFPDDLILVAMASLVVLYPLGLGVLIRSLFPNASDTARVGAWACIVGSVGVTLLLTLAMAFNPWGPLSPQAQAILLFPSLMGGLSVFLQHRKQSPREPLDI